MKISGVVRDAATKAPIEDAHVRLAVGDREIADTYTDRVGTFSLEERSGPIAEPGAILTIRAEKAGYREVATTQPIGPDNLRFELELGSEAEPEPLQPPGPQLPVGALVGAAAAALAVALALFVGPKIIDYFTGDRCDVEAYAALRGSTAEEQYQRAVACIERVQPSGDANAIALIAQHLLVPAANTGHYGKAALRLGQLYDPRPLTQDRMGQLPPDPVLAAERYRDALLLNEQSAQGELNAMVADLEQRAPSDRMARSSLESIRRRGLY